MDQLTLAPPKSARRLDIQGMRAFALIVILIYHARLPVPGGFIALDLFFVVSGFVIAQMLLREHSRNGRIDLTGFYLRRFRRLTPALALTVTAVALIAIFLESPFGAQQITAATAAGSMLFVANVVIAGTTGDYFAAAAESNPLLNIWSLSTEEQFYFIFPAAMVLGWFVARSRGWSARRGLASVVGGLAAISFGFALATSGPSLSWPMTAFFGYYGAVGRAWEFAAGALLALFAGYAARLPRAAAELLAWSGLAVILVGVGTLSEAVTYPGWATLIPVYGAAAIIAAGCAADTTVSRLMGSRPMVALGDMSYSWYLWHWPVVVFALALWPSHPILTPIVATLASFVPAWLAYRVVERPIRMSTRYSGKRLRNLAIVCFAVPLAAAAALAFGARNSWWLTWPTAYSYEDAAGYARGCHDTAPGQEACTWPVSGSAGTVLLLGDSQALSLSDGLIAANQRQGLTTQMSSHSQCPFIAEGRVSYTYEETGCRDWQQQALDYALDSRPSLVVIANRPYVNNMTGGVTLLDANGQVPPDSEASQAAWVDALDGVVRPLRQAGIPVLIVASPPEADYDSPPNGILQRGRSRTTVEDAERRREVALAADQQVVTMNPGTFYYDPLPDLCEDGICPDSADGRYLYSDPRHLSVAGSLQLTDSLEEAVTQAITRS